MLLRSQTAIASQIFNAKADYVLALKANHPTLHAQVKQWFEQYLQDRFSGIIHSYDQRVECMSSSYRKTTNLVRTPISTITPAQSK